eukprot:m.65405 g.65405  ORF g.65405 m.65405 type:complete len:71 (-) comp17979_c0_seq3:1809-2021(-)
MHSQGTQFHVHPASAVHLDPTESTCGCAAGVYRGALQAQYEATAQHSTGHISMAAVLPATHLPDTFPKTE